MRYRRIASSLLFTGIAAIAGAGTVGMPTAAWAAATTECAGKKGCEAKFCRIQTEIDQARANGNTRKEEGLKKALQEARDSCTEQRLAADRAEELRDAQDEVKEREQDLREAKEDGRQRKIERAERKLKEAQDELEEAKRNATE